MSCKQYDGQWEAYALGLLSDKERQKLDKHLAGCTSCQTELRRHQQAQKVLQGAFEDGPSDWLVQKTLARLREHKTRRSPWVTWGVPAMAGAAALLWMIVLRPAHWTTMQESAVSMSAPIMSAMAPDAERAAQPRRMVLSEQRVVTKAEPKMQPAPVGLLDLQLENPISDRSIYEDLGVATAVAKLLL